MPTCGDSAETLGATNGGEERRRRRPGTSPRRRQAKVYRDTLFLRFADKQMEISLSLVLLILGLNALFPHLRRSYELSTYQTRLPARQYTSPLPKFISLSYLDPTTGRFFKGNDDIYFVAFWTLVWVFLREALMKWFYKPLAGVVGVRGRGKVQRFAEQGWNVSYCSVFWMMGMKILLTFYPGRLLDVRQYWDGYPHDCLPALTKFYYLSQTAFWFQQMLVLNIEKRRKDYYQMFTHHIVTTLLVCTSYCTNFTGIGTALHTTMDLSDIFLSSAKMQKYADLGLCCDLTFVMFLLSWLYTRHYVFLKIVWAIYAYLPGDVGLIWNPDQGRFLIRSTWAGFLTLLLALQALLLVWLAMIIRVLARVIRGKGADDSRSDSEDTDEEGGETQGREEINGVPNGSTMNGSARHGKPPASYTRRKDD